MEHNGPGSVGLETELEEIVMKISEFIGRRSIHCCGSSLLSGFMY